MRNILILLISLSLFGCSDSNKEGCDAHLDSDLVIDEESDGEDGSTSDIKSEYDMGTVDKKDLKEFKENLEKIEKVHGEQWDFCTCVVKNDSINRAFSEEVSDAEFERLSTRFDEIDVKCKAFLAQSPNVTPADRAAHDKKVKNCLKESGL